jgi:hypothetical protein
MRLPPTTVCPPPRMQKSTSEALCRRGAVLSPGLRTQSETAVL